VSPTLARVAPLLSQWITLFKQRTTYNNDIFTVGHMVKHFYQWSHGQTFLPVVTWSIFLPVVTPGVKNLCSFLNQYVLILRYARMNKGESEWCNFGHKDQVWHTYFWSILNWCARYVTHCARYEGLVYVLVPWRSMPYP
jgi:hypothetical protein